MVCNNDSLYTALSKKRLMNQSSFNKEMYLSQAVLSEIQAQAVICLGNQTKHRPMHDITLRSHHNNKALGLWHR